MGSPALGGPVPAAVRRPVGLTLAAIVLALMTCWGVFTSGLFVYIALTVHTPQTDRYPAIAAIQIGMGAAGLLISCFCAATVYGLFRLQRWARVSMIILGGLLALSSAAMALLFFVLAFTPAVTQARGANVSPALFRGMLLGMGAFMVAVSCIGVWWLIYFNLRRVRAAFVSSGMAMQLQPGDALAVDGILEGNAVPEPVAQGGSAVEVLLLCLAILYLIGSASAVFLAAVHFPLLLVGVILRGTAASLAALLLAAVNAAVGVGLLRRIKAAWIGAFVLQGFGSLSSLLLLVPRYRRVFAEYTQEIVRSMFGRMSMPRPPAGQALPEFSPLVSILLASVMTGGIFWLLIAARPLFDSKQERREGES